MSKWLVECVGDVREVYSVEADSADDAMARWFQGDLVVSEAEGVEPRSAREDG